MSVRGGNRHTEVEGKSEQEYQEVWGKHGCTRMGVGGGHGREKLMGYLYNARDLDHR